MLLQFNLQIANILVGWIFQLVELELCSDHIPGFAGQGY